MRSIVHRRGVRQRWRAIMRAAGEKAPGIRWAKSWRLWHFFLGFDKPNEARDAGEPCANCGTVYYNAVGICGCWFCDICLGRGRDEDHQTGGDDGWAVGLCPNVKAAP